MGITAFLGWLAIGWFVITAISAADAARAYGGIRPAGREGDEAKARAWAWGAVAVILLLLAIGNVLHAQTLTLANEADGSIGGAAFADRVEETRIFTIAGFAFGTVLMFGLMMMFRGAGEAAVVGLIFSYLLGVLFGLRVAPFLKFEQFLTPVFFGIRVGDALNLIGLGIIAGCSTSRPKSSWISQSVPSRPSPRKRR